MIVPASWDAAIAAKLSPVRGYATALLVILALAIVVMAWKWRDKPQASLLLLVWLIMP